MILIYNYNYDKTMLISKIEELFNKLKGRSIELLVAFPDTNQASKMIVELVSSETNIRSKTILTDVYDQMSREVLASSDFSDSARKNRFYDMNLRSEIIEKYRFDITSLNSFQGGIPFKEINVMYASIAAAAGTTALGGILKYALINTIDIPIVFVVAGALLVFCGAYFKSVPNRNKVAFEHALNSFFMEAKQGFIAWFDEIERYFNKRVDELIKSF